MNQKKIGAFLKELRKEKGMTQEGLAELLGVTNRSVSRWETGVSLPDFDLVLELAGIFDVSVDELLDGERRMEMLDKKTEETLLKVADYENGQNIRFTKRLFRIFLAAIAAFGVYLVIEANGLASTGVYEDVASFSLGLVLGALLLGALFTSRYAARIRAFKLRLLHRLKGRP